MAIIGQDTKRIPIPHEVGEWVEVLDAVPPIIGERAAEAKQFEMLRMAAKLGANAVQQFRQMEGAPTSSGAPARVDATDATVPGREALDLDYVVSQMLVAWSYKDRDGKSIVPTRNLIERLDRETRAWLHDMAWEAVRPPTNDEQESNLEQSTMR